MEYAVCSKSIKVSTGGNSYSKRLHFEQNKQYIDSYNGLLADREANRQPQYCDHVQIP